MFANENKDFSGFLELAIASTRLDKNLIEYRKFCRDWVLPFMRCKKIISAIGSVNSNSYVIETMSEVGYPEGYFDLIDRVVSFKDRNLVGEWIKGQTPIIVNNITDIRSSNLEVFEFREYNLLPIALYGLVDISGYNATYFSFANIDVDGFCRSTVDCKIKMLVPILHRLFSELTEIGGTNLPDLDAVELLTAAEKEVFLLLLCGHSNKDIGIILGRSHLTIKNQAHEVFTKLGVAGRAELCNRFAKARMRNRHSS